jgi:hypothetical protein
MAAGLSLEGGGIGECEVVGMMTKVAYGDLQYKVGLGKASVGGGRLKKAVLDEAVVAGMGKDHMVKERDTEYIRGLAKAASDVTVLGGRIQAARWMVVGDDDSARIVFNGSYINFSRMNNGAIH